MSTKIYGASDDLVEIEGDIGAEHANFGTDDRDHGSLVILSDGTLLDVKYGKGDMAIWQIILIHRGILFDRIDQCDDEDAEIYSDIAYFKDGIKWAYFARDWEKAH